MKKVICLAGCLLLSGYILHAQDEGVIKKRERIDRSKSIFLSGGGSAPFGKNIGDYSFGTNVEIGFLKRLNRILSVGPSVSYYHFKYDPEVTTADRDAFYGDGDISIEYPSAFDTWNEKYGLDEDYRYAYVLTLEGGNLSLISLAANIKVNFIPVTDKRIVSVYGFAKPFVTYAKREAVSGSGKRWIWQAYEDKQGTASEADDLLYYNQTNEGWRDDDKYVENWDSKGYPALEEESSVTGGIFIGPGVEFAPAKAVSGFFQIAFGYTFPVSYISTKSYDNTIQSYANDEFPIVKKGFPSLNIQFGVSYNF
jgi:hypothetical protein